MRQKPNDHLNNTIMRSEKQVKINRSCIECRRRKVRCDGQQPCSNCVWYVVAENCQYQPRRRRNCSSNKPGNQIAAGTAPRESAQDTILSTLFPGSSAEYLAKLSHGELVQLAQDGVAPSPRKVNPHTLGDAASDQGSDTEDEHEWNERQENDDPAAAVCDDVNGLSLHLNLQSYLGISSVRAALRTMFRLSPSIRAYVRQRIATWEVSASWGLSTGASPIQEGQLSNPTIDEVTCIDAYFLHAHEITPMLDEADFRTTWKQGHRTDGPWLALMNMVLVLGSISIGTGDDESHRFYYARAKQYINFELFGAGCMESLQALCLLGGYYLHYKNSPNMAHAVMGAALRIAIGLGLHRNTASLEPKTESARAGSRPQLRRQLWWSLFCLDTWSHMTLGRPSQGRWDPKTMNVLSPSYSEHTDSATLSLDLSQAFCKIATRVQDRFAQLAPLSISELKAFDDEVQAWHRNLPPEFRYREMCPDRLLTAHSFMCNRFFNLRLLLHRPVLLSYANRKVPFDSLLPEEQAAINSCQEIACSAIDNIASGFNEPNRLRVWNSVWYLYQVTMVTLVSIIVDPNHPNAARWKASTEKSLQLFQSVAPWTKAADRSREVLASIYEATQMPQPLPQNDVHVPDIPYDFDIPGMDQFGFNAFGADWQWDAFNGFEEDFGQLPSNLTQW